MIRDEASWKKLISEVAAEYPEKRKQNPEYSFRIRIEDPEIQDIEME
jgi:hypothetical protein